jgi:hypothetical protein
LQALKQVCWGGSNMMPRPEWIKSSIAFNDPEQLNAFGLKAEKVIANYNFKCRYCFRT